jgi:hypothetical protein
VHIYETRKLLEDPAGAAIARQVFAPRVAAGAPAAVPPPDDAGALGAARAHLPRPLPPGAGSALPGLAAGSVLYVGAGGVLAQDAQLAWEPAGNVMTAGNIELGTWPPNSSFAFFGHSALDQTNAGNYAFMGNSVGDTFFNCASGREMYFRVGNATDALHVSASGHVGVGTTSPTASLLVVADTVSAASANVYDVGSAATPWRTLYAGTSLDLGGTAWVRNDPGTSRLTADVANATTTFSNLPDLSATVVAGRKYTGRLVLKCRNSTAAGGVKIDFGGGTATMTSFWAVASPAGTAGSGGTIATGTLVGTALTGAVNYTTITGETLITAEVSFVVSAGGTLIPRFATNSAGTVTAELGSWLRLWDSRN